ncbi:MAG: hypothetical protein KDJ75_08875 [Alphaproteobacteria bacterium]|nr:hypothetical protein [Alphaproteobacteria bacterium]
MTSHRTLRLFSFKFATLAVLALALGGCLTTELPAYRLELAKRIATPAWMIKREIPAGPFALTAFERIHKRGGVANVYIEGDGDMWETRSAWNINPTPQNPVALHLASKDSAENVIYLARPCQYSGMLDEGQTCDPAIWKQARYGRAAVDSMSAALDELSRRYSFRGYHLIGYSGGAALAGILAAERKDVLSLRTVAGVMDPDAQSKLIEDTPPLSASLTPVSDAVRLANIPQYHFIGGQDRYVPPGVLHSYLQALPPTRCAQVKMIQEAEHDVGWVDKWPELLEKTPECHAPVALPAFEDFVPLPEPVFVTREKPAKP